MYFFTVRLGFRVSLIGPSEILESQMLLLLKENSDIYNTGQKSGLFTMRVVRLKKVSTQRFHHPAPAVPQD
ncbi:hypothetical protein ILYODFUR_015808 [Ilyodon furcidens]|uniref:Uncharacterized protein n=2 Tax=Goodeidae TaxID=28758 RepID=A0ABV0UIB7_9TELE